MLSPSTSYAGDYIWQGDDRSGCERILTDAKISKDEWQMGVTKAFIKNPETVRLVISFGFPSLAPCRVSVLVSVLVLEAKLTHSSSTSKASATDTGTPWPLGSNAPGAPTSDGNTRPPRVSSDSGAHRKKRSCMRVSGTMGMKSWRGGKSGGGLVCWGCASFMAIIWMWGGIVRLGGC